MFDKIEIYDLLHNQTIPSVPIQDYYKYEDNSLKDYPEMYRMKISDDIYDRYWINECF